MGIWQWQNNTWNDNTIKTTIDFTESPKMTIYPAMVALPNPEPEKKSNNPLDWLREQISEICELALVV